MEKPKFMPLDLYPLTDGWVPPKLLVREKQLKRLLANYWSSYWSNFWIYGDRGLGKTLTAKIFSRIDENVFVIPMESESFKRNINNFALLQGIKPKLTGDPDSTLREVIESKASGEGGVTIIFDDVENLGRSFSGFGIHLKALYDWLLDHGYKFSIHCISKLSVDQAKKRVLDAAWSRLNFEPLVFPPYNKGEIVELLKQRLKYIDGLKWTDVALELIGEYVSEMGGDFRLALKITRKTVLDHGKIDYDAVSKTVEVFGSSFYLDEIMKMSFHKALILAAIVRETVNRHGGIPDKEDWEYGYFPVSWDRVKGLYWTMCKQLGRKPQHQKMLYHWLEQLWKEGWVEKFTLAKRHEWNYVGKRSLFARLTADLKLLANAFKRVDWGRL
ncbi:MAG: hypothetical protein ACTSXC_03070 [Candidatus Freyarchaeota archaeon]